MSAARFRMLGVELDPLTIDDLHARIAEALAQRRRFVIGHQNLHGLYLHEREPAMRRFAEIADLTFVDGMALVTMGRRLGHPVGRRHRVTYADWIDPLMAECASRGWRVFHLGGRSGVGERAAAELRRRHVGLAIETATGYLDPGANEAVLAGLATTPPDLLLVGMGMPRQERWVVDNLERIPPSVVLTCGACMDYVAGEIPTPPRWTGRWGVEWLFRLLAEPRRLAGRYLREPWPVLGRFLREWAGSGDSRLES